MRKMTYEPSKLGHTDLVYGLSTEFITRSVHAKLQVSKCIGYNLSHCAQYRHTERDSC